ncbi:Binding-protein-dependent transport systems inner membrane component [Planctomycetales bacterium 10988]|nr:Binding-protein-dependent transport systems inner membrane component [Planctomycetales bacterium 10988]
MTQFILRRLVWMALTLWAVFTISFILMKSVPGGPYSSERALSPEIQKNFEARYGLDKPLIEQYFDQLTYAITFDLGMSTRLKDFTVNEVIAQGLPISATLGVIALSFALILGLTTGVLSALGRGTFTDVFFMSIATVGIAIPNFVIASITIILFVFLWQLFPAAGWGSASHLILPAFALGAPYAAYIARLTRTGMLEVLSQDYIRTARAKGLPTYQVVYRHALQGAILPVVSYLGPAIAGVLTGSVVIERIFSIPGLGSHFIDAALQRDYTLAMSLVLVYTTLLYTMNFLVDLSYTFLDPRVKIPS